MKGELLVIDDNLTFIFRRSDVNSNADKLAISSMISHLYHMHGVDVTPSKKLIEDILKISNQSIFIGLNIDHINNKPKLKIIDLTEKKLQELRKLVFELAELEEVR